MPKLDNLIRNACVKLSTKCLVSAALCRCFSDTLHSRCLSVTGYFQDLEIGLVSLPKNVIRNTICESQLEL